MHHVYNYLFMCRSPNSPFAFPPLSLLTLSMSPGIVSRIKLPSILSCAIAPGPAPYSIAVALPPIKVRLRGK